MIRTKDFVLPTTTEARVGDWHLDNFTVSEADSRMTSMRPGEYVPPGDYTRIKRGQTTVMSDTPMERGSHMEILRKAKGHVLINGLGLGMIAETVARKDDVESVTVIEIAPEVVHMIAPHLHPKCNVIRADAFEWQPPKGMRYGAVWHDIWDTICADNLADMKFLHRKYGRRCDWQGSWQRDVCEYHRKQDRQWGW